MPIVLLSQTRSLRKALRDFNANARLGYARESKSVTNAEAEEGCRLRRLIEEAGFALERVHLYRGYDDQEGYDEWLLREAPYPQEEE